MSEQTPIDLIKFLASDDYSFIFRASLKPEDIFVTFDAQSIIETNEVTEGLIEDSWEKECAMALKEDRVHFDTLGYSLVAWSFDTFRKIKPKFWSHLV